MRIKAKWYKKAKPKTAEELGGAMGYIAWKVALNAVQRLLAEEYEIKLHERRFAIMEEFLAFLVQASDRYAYGRIDDDQRRRFIIAYARRVAETLEDNQRDFLGEGEYQQRFIDLLNERMADYAELSFVDGEPGYSALRYLGDRVKVLTDGFDQKWMLEQVIDVEAPEAVRYLKRSWEGLFEVEVT